MKIKEGQKIKAIIKPKFNKVYKSNEVIGEYHKFEKYHLIIWKEGKNNLMMAVDKKDITILDEFLNSKSLN